MKYLKTLLIFLLVVTGKATFAQSEPPDDVLFTSEMIDTIAADFNINLDRVYACGMSFGGFFSVFLAGQLSDKIAAIASVAGTVLNNVPDSLISPIRPIAFLEIHGTDDNNVPYNGNQAAKSVQYVLDLFVNHNNCDTSPSIAPLPNINPNDGSTVERYIYANGDNGTTVEHLKIDGGRHTWPDENTNAQGVNRDINGCVEIWKFFSKFDMNGAIAPPVSTKSIHDFSKPLQRQLMQVLQSKEFLPIGSTKKEQTNFRLITATNLNFNELQNRLDADFLDRIAQYVVEIPPIRDCREDIFRYWETTWKSSSDGGVSPKSKELERFLNTYPFQGNFRDLQRLAHYLFAFSKTKTSEEAVSLAIKSVEKWQSKSIENVSNHYFQNGKSYNEIVNQFNQDFANWAVSAYGSRKVACEHLEMTEAWLSKAINGKSR